MVVVTAYDGPIFHTRIVSTSPHSHVHDRTIEVISSDQQLQAQLRRYVHIRDVFALRMLLVVVQVLTDLLEYNTTD